MFQRKKGIKIDIKKLEELLGTKVLKISALKGTGIDDLIKEIKNNYIVESTRIYDQNIENVINDITKVLPKETIHKRFVAIKLLEEDERFENLNTINIKKIASQISGKYDTDLEETIAMQRYRFIENVKNKSFHKVKTTETISDKLDKIFLNKWLAFPIFVAIMFLVYYLSVGVVGMFTVDWVAGIVENFGENVRVFLEKIGTSQWLNSLVVDGIIAGVGAVLGFVPQLIILFICISVLETTGYMSRIALLLDKLFRKIGLSGKV